MKKIFLIALSALTLASCVDMLNLSPTNQISSGNMWSTESLAQKGMDGLYVNFYRQDLSRIQLRSSDFSGINRQGWMGMGFAGDFLGDNSSPLPPLWDQSKPAKTFVVWYEWKWAYTAIHQINEALANLPNSPLSEEVRERFICEARFLRAWYYTRLNKIFGGTDLNHTSVPLYLRVISDSECTQSQASVNEVWNAVLADLTYCINSPHMQNNTLTTNYGRPSKGAAYALRGMAYMYYADKTPDGQSKSGYALAVEDFEKVSECGYDFWKGKYIDMFHHLNEKNSEMIFAIQFSPESGYCDNLQLIIGGRDTWNSWSNIRPSSDFVDYFQNSDGTKFEWNKVEGFEDWDKLTPAEREVYFLRDGFEITWNESENKFKGGSGMNPVTETAFKESHVGEFCERATKIGKDVFLKYYRKDGNEDRVNKAYEERDPRLHDIVLVPYQPYDTFKDKGDNGGKIQIGKELRWPFFSDLEGDDYGDYYMGDNQSMYLFKKFSYNKPDDLEDRLKCPTDWPLIRYTDVALQLAEAYVELGETSKAVDIVNTIRTRAGMPPITAGSKEDMREAVRYERRIELSIECHSFFDEWRWGTYKEMKFQGKDVYGDQSWWKEWDGYREKWYYHDNMYPWPVPAQEYQRNPNLIPTLDGGCWAY